MFYEIYWIYSVILKDILNCIAFTYVAFAQTFSFTGFCLHVDTNIPPGAHFFSKDVNESLLSILSPGMDIRETSPYNMHSSRNINSSM